MGRNLTKPAEILTFLDHEPRLVFLPVSEESGNTKVDHSRVAFAPYALPDDEEDLKPWWELGYQPSRRLTHEMVSEALWRSVMLSARETRYKFYNHVPKCLDKSRRRQMASTSIMRFKLLLQLVSNWHEMGLVRSHSENFRALHGALEEMQQGYESKYDAHRVY